MEKQHENLKKKTTKNKKLKNDKKNSIKFKKEK